MIDVILHDNSKKIKELLEYAMQESLREIGEQAVVEWQYEIKKQNAILTGRYLNSINYVITDTNIVYVGTAIGINDGLAPYPVYLEYGTSRISPRNIGRNAMEEIQKKVEGIVVKMFAKIR